MGYLKEIKEFIARTEEEDFYLNDGHCSVRQQFEWFIEWMKKNYPASYKKNWLYYSENPDGRGHYYKHHIIWVQNNEFKEFILEDEGY